MPEVADAPVTTKFFRKEIISTPLFLKSGGKAPFEAVGSDIGLLKTSDAALIEQLELAIRKRMGGVVSISSDEYEELKKNPPVRRLKPTSSKPWQADSQPRNQSAVVAATNQKATPLKVPDPEPLLAQLSELKKRPGRLGDVVDVVKKVQEGAK